jgi:hypothetical protein
LRHVRIRIEQEGIENGQGATMSKEEQVLYRNAELVAIVQRRIESESLFETLPLFLQDLFEQGAWIQFKIAEHAPVFDYRPGDAQKFWEFVQTAQPKGLGTTIPKLRQICEMAEEPMKLLSMLDELSQRGPGGANNPEGLGGKSGKKREVVNRDNITIDNERDYTAENERRGAHGTSREAALRRLRKDRPDLHEQVLSGELTPHEAMLEAGFRKPTATIRLDDMAALVETLKKRLSPEQIDEIKSLL